MTKTKPMPSPTAGYGNVPKPNGKHIAVGSPKTKALSGRRNHTARPGATKAGY